MDFYAVLDEVVELVRSRGRVSYRALREQFGLDDERLDALRAELAVCLLGRIAVRRARPGLDPRRPLLSPRPNGVSSLSCSATWLTRRRCPRQLDPEDLREVMRAYYKTCGQIIDRFDGYIAQYLGDGLLVFFGYPQAHEDDAHRAVRAGLAHHRRHRAGRRRPPRPTRRRAGRPTRMPHRTRRRRRGRRRITPRVDGDGRHPEHRRPPSRRRRGGHVGNRCRDHRLLGGFFDCRSLGTPPLKGVDRTA